MILTRAGELKIAPRVSMDMAEVYEISPSVARKQKTPRNGEFFEE
jgi:hypothetical protein